MDSSEPFMRKPAFGLLHRLASLIAKISSLVLFLFWGAFFVEHLTWFEDPATWPPPTHPFSNTNNVKQQPGAGTPGRQGKSP